MKGTYHHQPRLGETNGMRFVPNKSEVFANTPRNIKLEINYPSASAIWAKAFEKFLRMALSFQQKINEFRRILSSAGLL